MAKTPENEHPVKAFGWAATEETGLRLFPFDFSRRATGEKDVRFKVLYCAICRSDLKALERTWGITTTYPVVPGHEITGIVTEVGSKVLKFKVGDNVGVGCTIGSCRHCYYCLHDLENYCPEWMCTFNTTYYDGTKNYGGFSDSMVVDEHFCIGFPDNMPLDRGAPLLCAGIAAYSALKYYELTIPGLHIGVLGLGGVGHLAVKFLKAFGARVTVISTSPDKKMDALEHFGADSFLFSSDPAQMEAAKATMDGIFDTAPKSHPISPLLSLLKVDRKLVVVGEPEKLEVPIFPLITGRKQVAGSTIGGQKEIQEMIYFAAEHNIMADIEIIPMDDVNKAMDRLSKDDIRYRFVIDIANTLGVPRA